MVTEILLSTILTTSIAGGGLLIAIYTLIAQLRNKLFEKRLDLLKEKNAEFDKTKQSITPEQFVERSEELKGLASEIISKGSFPSYLSYVKWVFAGYISCALVCVFWLADTVQNAITGLEDVVQNSQAEFFLIFIFVLVTLGFAVIVLYAVKDVHELMKADFEALKKEQEKTETLRKDVEEAKKKLREMRER
jgi:hypothetical protein